jgi:membrane fusion protein (multidrug efflux system)
LQSAEVIAVEPTVDRKTRTLLIRASIQNKDASLVPGTSAKVSLTLDEQSVSLFVPTTAMIPSIKGYSVFRINGGKASATTVKAGLRTPDFVQILEGLHAGDTLVTTNLLRIKNGSPVIIKKIN